ncbi:ependymin-related protein 1-like [Haliotis rubra]|uniref:ependymin-related protein 1-like n=1 Tax=Haliotis rubra TaxID=36100 RepID=UPI001EE55E9F|nr:ependymin-related protein 1-like [Haliotis rubra]
MILQVALLLAGLSVASGSICCPHKQFNAFQYVNFVNSTTTIEALYYIVYDGINQRYIITGDRSNNQFLSTTKVIYDYKQSKAYSIDAEARTCTTFPLQGNFEDQQNVCVPSYAVSVGPFFYGYNRDRLNTQSYTYNRTALDGGRQRVTVVVSEADCVPIVISRTTTGGAGGNSLYTVGYNDFYPGIRDITVFDIPSYC